MSNVNDSAARAASTGGGGDQKGRIPKQLIILPSSLPANAWQFFRLLDPNTLAERYIHWIKLPQFEKEIPVPCLATASQHAAASSWTVADVCPMCKMVHDKDPRHVMNRYSPDKPNIQHQWAWKVQPITALRGADQKITGMQINPAVHLLQVTQATLFKAIVAAKDDPELPSGDLSTRALKLYRGLEPGKEAKDTKYQAAYSQSILQNIPTPDDKLPTIEEIETPLTATQFSDFLNAKPADKKDAAAGGQQAPSAQGGGQQTPAVNGGKVDVSDAEF